MPSLQDAIDLLGSVKGKDRMEGLDQYKDLFGRDRTLRKLGGEGADKDVWLTVMQPLFRCVMTERGDSIKKDGSWQKAAPIVLKRLKDSAAVVRMMVERCASSFDGRVAVACFKHLTQAVHLNDSVLEPIALDYAKALGALLSYKPHVDRLSYDHWCTGVAHCFNILFGDSLRQALDAYVEDEVEIDPRSPKFKTIPGMANAHQESPNGSRTRGRVESQGRSGRLEDVEQLSCLVKLVSADTAPLIGGSRLGVKILQKYARFFMTFRTESSAHLPALVGLNRLLEDLALNEGDVIEIFVQLAWDPIVSLWGSKHKPVKEQATIALSALQPFLRERSVLSTSSAAGNALRTTAALRKHQGCLDALHRQIVSECDHRSGLQPLKQPAVELCLSDRSPRSRALLQYPTIGPSRVFSVGDAQTWATLELGADVIWELCELEEDLASAPAPVAEPAASAPAARKARKTRTSASVAAALVSSDDEAPATAASHASKRRKVDSSSAAADALDRLVLNHFPANPGENFSSATTSRVWRIQLLLFLIMRHNVDSQPGLVSRAAALLLRLLSTYEEAELQSWVLICFAALASATASSPTGESDLGEIWAKAWPLACRRTSSPQTSRAAAHAASLILHHRLAPVELCISELRSLLADLDMQGPPIHPDSVCAFLGEAVRFSTTHAGATGGGLRERVLQWLQGVWSPLGSSKRLAKSVTTQLEPVALARLLATICNFVHVPAVSPAAPPLPSCSAITALVNRARTEPVRSYLQKHQLSSVEAAPAPSDAREASQGSLEEDGQQTASSQNMALPSHVRVRSHLGPLEDRCRQLLQTTLTSLLMTDEVPRNGTDQDGDLTAGLVTMASSSQLSSALEVVVTAQLFLATCRLNFVRPPADLAKLTSSATVKVLSVASNPKWSAAERRAIFHPLTTLLPSAEALKKACAGRDADSALLQPGREAGVATRLLMSVQRPVDHAVPSLSPASSAALWASFAEPGQLRAQLLNLLRIALNVDEEEEREASPVRRAAPVEDEWAIQKASSTPAAEDTSPDGRADADALATSCVSALECVAALAGHETKPALDEDLLRLLPRADPEDGCAPEVRLLEEVKAGRVHLSERDVRDLIDDLGSYVMLSYEYGRTLNTSLLTVRFVDSTLPIWPRDGDAELSVNAEKIVTFLVKSLTKADSALQQQWPARIALAHFMERLLFDSTQPGGYQPVNPRISRSALVKAILGLVRDKDVRVRFAVAPMAARVLERASALGLEPSQLYDQLREQLPDDLDNPELMLTRIVTLGNVMVSTSCVRDKALYHLLELSMIAERYRPCTAAVLQGVAGRLGFTALKELWRAFCAPLTWMLVNGDYDIFSLPVQVLGYESRKELLLHTYRPTASMLLAISAVAPAQLDVYEQLNAHCRKSKSAGLRECLPFLTAVELGFIVDEMRRSQTKSFTGDEADNAEAWKKLQASLVARPGFEGSQRDGVSAELGAMTHDVVACLLSAYYDTRSLGQDEILEAAQRGDAGGAQHIAAMKAEPRSHALTANASLVRNLHEPSRPFFDAVTVISALCVLDHAGLKPFAAGTVYNVIFALASAIESTHLVNDQVRHARVLCLYSGLAHSALKANPGLVRTLLHVAAALLANEDLRGEAMDLVQYCTTLQTANKLAVPGLGAELVLVLDRLETLDGPAPAHGQLQPGSSWEWLEKIFARLAAQPEARADVQLALCTWPSKELPISLTMAPPTLLVLSRALASLPSDAINTWMLDRLAVALNDAHADDRASFSRTHMWRILSPSATSTQATAAPTLAASARARAISRVLFACDGRVSTPDVIELERREQEELDHYGPGVAFDASGGADLRMIKAFITTQALAVLRSTTDMARAAFILGQLRAVMQIEGTLLKDKSLWPRSVAAELSFAAAFGQSLAFPAHRTISELASIGAGGIAADPSRLARHVAKLLCDLLSQGQLHFFGQISVLVDRDAELAQKLLPAIVHAFLSIALTMDEGESIARHLSAGFKRVLNDVGADRRSWKAIIDVVLHLRKFPPDDTPHSCDGWLELDYREMAECARACGLYASALLFIELAREREGALWPAALTSTPIVTALYDIYGNIEDPDSFYGIRSADLGDALVRRLHHEGQWSRAFEMHAAQYENRGAVRAQTSLPLVECMHEMGFNALANGFSHAFEERGQGAVAESKGNLTYDIAWRTADWDLPQGAPASSGNKSLFGVMRALNRERDPIAIRSLLDAAFTTELRELQHVGAETSRQLREAVRGLLLLGEADTWAGLIAESGTKPLGVNNLSSSWASLSDAFSFEDLEQILTVRHVLLRGEKQRDLADHVGPGLPARAKPLAQLESRILLRLVDAARDNARFQVAHSALALAQQADHDLGRFSASDSSYSREIQEAFAGILWEQSEHGLAIEALEGALAKAVSTKAPPEATARMLARLGSWRATARSHQPRAIDTLYFGQAWKQMRAVEDLEERARVSHGYAVFADSQYRTLARSEEIRKLEHFVAERTEEIRTIEAERSRTRGGERGAELNRQLRRAQKMRQLDKAQLDERQSSRAHFQLCAAHKYAEALCQSDLYDDDVVRLTSIWFESSADGAFDASMRSSLLKIPSHKFVQLTHQLSARLTTVYADGSAGLAPGTQSPSPDFSRNLFDVMNRMCCTHPFHALYALYALRKGARDEADAASQNGSRRKGAPMPSPSASSQQLRGAAAEAIINNARSVKHQRDRVVAWEHLCDASVEWAELHLQSECANLFDGNTIRRGPHRIPVSLALSKLRNVDVPPATLEVPLDPSGLYRDVVGIARFSDTFNTAGGIHLPKITECIASDGQRLKQLYKSDDDLRQDAVMEQVFRVVNALLGKDRAARLRKLRVRTYAVIPLGPQCGLLEFVRQTEPIGEPILAMHTKHGSGEISPREARQRIHEASGRTLVDKVAAYEDVCAMMKPKLRHYFLELHKLPLAWLEVRLNYARSVATTSIVGHILGLGDRHVSNILLDKANGEVVHIDFGVAFEQGKLLPVPELIPFRLTRDIIDPMGLSGVEGVFRRCCEETLRVLREGADVVKTVLEVFKYDPLFDWTSSPVKIIRAQADGDEDDYTAAARSGRLPGGTPATRDNAEALAERSISTVMEKLSPTLSVEYAINDLIQKATDSAKLGSLFHGWQAAL